MTHFPSRCGAIFLTLLLPAVAPAQTVDGTSPPAVDAAVPVASVAPAAPGQPIAASDMLHTDAHGRHLAPHGTLYLLEYVSVKTDKGVEGFEPGQEVHVVAAHRATHTLVVSDGRAQIEISPDKLTNDMDIAAMVRRKDQTNQASIAAYVQKEQDDYNKFEKQAAEATAKDVERADKQQAASSTIVDNSINATQTAQPAATTADGSAYNNYYGSNGYGYGNSYSYFDGGGSVTIVNPGGNRPSNNGTAPSNGGTNPANQGTAGGGKVAAPDRGCHQSGDGRHGRTGGRAVERQISPREKHGRDAPFFLDWPP